MPTLAAFRAPLSISLRAKYILPTCQHHIHSSQPSTNHHPRWTCSASRRRRNVGVPKNIDLGEPFVQLTPEESPWDDYLIPQLPGNASVSHVSRFQRGAKPFLVLGVETSCDDTAAAVVRSDGLVLSECRVSQDELTQMWGGVVPHVARDAHERAIESVIQRAMEDAGVQKVDAVGATMGPGLEVCLRVGYRAARRVANELAVDFVAVNHLEAHVLVSRLGRSQDVEYPFVTLLVSGGHCQILLARGVADYEVLGGTLDDALGEAFDKTARLLGLSVGGGGGAALEKLAEEGDPFAIPFPVPMRKRADCNFSFAGLKTSVRVAIDKLGGDEAVRGDRKKMGDIAASFQEIAVQHLEQRVRRALRICEEHKIQAKTVVVSGGVAANKVVRTRLEAVCDDAGWKCVIPQAKLCTDNGVMVAWAAIERLWMGIADDTTCLDVRARWPLATLSELGGELPMDVSK